MRTDTRCCSVCKRKSRPREGNPCYPSASLASSPRICREDVCARVPARRLRRDVDFGGLRSHRCAAECVPREDRGLESSARPPIERSHRFLFAPDLVPCRSLSVLIILEPINHLTSEPPSTTSRNRPSIRTHVNVRGHARAPRGWRYALENHRNGRD